MIQLDNIFFLCYYYFMKRKKIYIILTIIFLILIDQISKLITSKYLLNSNIVLIPKFLLFSYVKNFGAAFGILEGKRVLFIVITVIVSSYLIYELIKSDNKFNTISLVLIISGIMGNFIDRVVFGYVRDFISFSIFNPVFNLADSFIVVGVILYIINMFVGDKNESKK